MFTRAWLTAKLFALDSKKYKNEGESEPGPLDSVHDSHELNPQNTLVIALSYNWI